METEKSSQTESDKQTDTAASVSAETIPNSEKPKKSKRKTMKEKWKDLIREKRSWKTRLLISLLVSLSFAYTLTVFGPFELYLPNMSYFTFSFLDMAPSMILVGIGVTAGLTLILMLLRGKFFTYIRFAHMCRATSSTKTGDPLTAHRYNGKAWHLQCLETLPYGQQSL